MLNVDVLEYFSQCLFPLSLALSQVGYERFDAAFIAVVFSCS